MLKVDLTVVSPRYNVSEDIEKFEEVYEIINKTKDEVDILSASKDLKQIL
jgi:hypothetical protein